MNTIRTGLLGLAIGFLAVSCGSSDDDDAATAATGGRAAGLSGAGGSSAGTGARGGSTASGGGLAGGGNATTGGIASTGGRVSTGGASTGGAPATGGTPTTGGVPTTGGASATGGTGGTPSGDQTCTDVCTLLDSTTLTCVPSPCVDTCATKYNAVVAASANCGAAYLALLNCGLTKPADSWVCYAIPTTTTSIPVPPYSSGAPDGCQTEFNALISAVLGNLACVTALMS